MKFSPITAIGIILLVAGFLRFNSMESFIIRSFGNVDALASWLFGTGVAMIIGGFAVSRSG